LHFLNAALAGHFDFGRRGARGAEAALCEVFAPFFDFAPAFGFFFGALRGFDFRVDLGLHPMARGVNLTHAIGDLFVDA
jgi:hypothetical protein